MVNVGSSVVVHGKSHQVDGVGGKRPGPASSPELRERARGIFEDAVEPLRKLATGEGWRQKDIEVDYECEECGHRGKVDTTIGDPPSDRDVLTAISMAAKLGLKADAYDIQFVRRLFSVVRAWVEDLPGGPDALAQIDQGWQKVCKEYE